jgi:hypothetical protein
VNEANQQPVSLLTTLTPGDYILSGYASAEQNPNVSFDASSAERVMSVALTVVPTPAGSALLLGTVLVACHRRRSLIAL